MCIYTALCSYTVHAYINTACVTHAQGVHIYCACACMSGMHIILNVYTYTPGMYLYCIVWSHTMDACIHTCVTHAQGVSICCARAHLLDMHIYCTCTHHTCMCTDATCMCVRTAQTEQTYMCNGCVHTRAGHACIACCIYAHMHTCASLIPEILKHLTCPNILKTGARAPTFLTYVQLVNDKKKDVTQLV